MESDYGTPVHFCPLLCTAAKVLGKHQLDDLQYETGTRSELTIHVVRFETWLLALGLL
jgi:hypothetical protein